MLSEYEADSFRQRLTEDHNLLSKPAQMRVTPACEQNGSSRSTTKIDHRCHYRDANDTRKADQQTSRLESTCGEDPYGESGDCKNAKECDERDDRRLDDLVRVNNFGSVEIDWETRNLTLSLRRTDATQMYRYKHRSGTDAGQAVQTQSYRIPTDQS